jgi:hypothetical protein
MVRRDALLDVGRFDEALPAHQDYDLYIRLLSRYRTGWINERSPGITTKLRMTKCLQAEKIYCRARKILSIKYCNDPDFPLLRKSFRRLRF